MMIPFFGLVYYLSTIDDYQQIKLNNTYRIENTRQNALSRQRIYIYERFGIFERNIGRPDYQETIEKVLTTDTTNLKDLSKIPIQNAKLADVNENGIGIEYQFNNKKKVVYSYFNNDDGY